jgi:hypothetical protein
MNRDMQQYPDGTAHITVERLNPDGSHSFSVFATIGLTDEINDLALLTITPESSDTIFSSEIMPILAVSQTEPNVGDEVIMSGFRGDEIKPFSTFGKVAMVSDRETESNGLPPKTVFFDLTSLPGNSGAPILATSSGKVIGVQLGALNWTSTPTSMSYSANSTSLSKLISDQLSLAPTLK